MLVWASRSMLIETLDAADGMMDQAAFGRQGAAGACSIAPRTKRVEAAFLRIERAQFFHSNGPPRLRRRYDAKCGATCPLISDHRGVELGPFSPPSFFDR